MADEGYYEDDYYDDYYGSYDQGGEPAEETWESNIEVKFDDAKSLLDYNTPECIRLMKALVDEDEAKGIWSFKAYIVLATAARNTQQYEDMLRDFTQAMTIAESGIDLAAAEAPIMQFISDASSVPPECLEPVVNITLKLAQDHPELWKVRCTAFLKRATAYLRAGDSASAVADLEAVQTWCTTDTTQSEDQHIAQLYQTYVLQLWAYRLKRQYGALRPIYYEAVRIQPPFVSLASIGDVNYEGGHMFLRDGDWYAAHRAFTLAFRAYSGTADPRRFLAIKYSALANMLGGATVEVLSCSENKALSNSAELAPVTSLEEAAVARDVPEVLRVLEDKANAAVLKDDALFSPYLDQLLYRLRLDAVGDYVQGFTSVKIESVARHIVWDVESTAELCTVAIYHGLNATLDAVANVLYVYDSTTTSEMTRAKELREWATTATLA